MRSERGEFRQSLKLSTNQKHQFIPSFFKSKTKCQLLSGKILFVPSCLTWTGRKSTKRRILIAFWLTKWGHSADKNNWFATLGTQFQLCKYFHNLENLDFAFRSMQLKCTQKFPMGIVTNHNNSQIWKHGEFHSSRIVSDFFFNFSLNIILVKFSPYLT